jgi:lipid-A-disaccharide synthase
VHTDTDPAPTSPVFALVAGEASGDALGAGLIAALQQRFPDARFVGIGGPLMIAAGLDAWYPAEKLAVMGLVEVLAHLPELLRIRADVRRRVVALRPAAFIGIDAPDFNLGLERGLKAAGIRTVHYVSPSVWAWREGRARKLGRSADLVLCLFPMEPPIYARYGVSARFVGHPAADRFGLATEREPARHALGLALDRPVLALLPGSRLGEIRRLGADFLEAARRCQTAMPGLQLIAPMASPACRATFETQARAAGFVLDEAMPDDPAPGETEAERPRLHLVDGRSRDVLLACDVVLLASGTAALEAMLAKRPMVVAYKLAPLTYRLVRWFKLMRTDVYSLPNILAGRPLVPELMQDTCTPAALTTALLSLLESAERRADLVREFERLHAALRGDADQAAAQAVASFLAPTMDAAH